MDAEMSGATWLLSETHLLPRVWFGLLWVEKVKVFLL